LIALALLVLSIGIADSINPSTVAPALYLALGRDAIRSLAGFTAGVFGVYLAGGIALTLGPGSAIPHPGPTVKHLIELALGAGTLLFAIALWLTQARVARLTRERRPTGGSSLLLGATIMAVELPTAFPYFAAIAAIVASGRGPVADVLLLVLFNTAFVAPLLAIIVLRAAAGARGRAQLEELRRRLERHAPLVLPLLLVAIAAALLLVGGVGLATESG
jgi:cytochrome c biogenesis protein CcdA